MRSRSLLLGALVALASGTAAAEGPTLPKRHLPPEVIAGLRLLDRDFERALAQDCAPERCFSKGCTYVDHSVVDQAATGSLPGLRLDEPGPGGAPSQVFLTTAECAFAHEASIKPRDARTLATRLKAKVSRGFTQVNVVYERLKPLPEFIREPPEPPPAPAEPDIQEAIEEEEAAQDADAGIAEPPPPPQWDAAIAAREAWTTLLPHMAWMIGLIMLTLAALIVIWALRRLGRQSPEEQLLMAQMLTAGEPDKAEGAGELGAGNGQPAAPLEALPEPPMDVAGQLRAWHERFARTGDDATDPALQALVTDLLRTGERRLLAKAMMLFPEELPKAFPKGDLASEKFELAEYLKVAETGTLPSDAAFFDKLNRYAISSSLTSHPDTDLIRGLHDDFGAAALADVVAAVPARYGALLFAMAPEPMQYEAAGLLSTPQVGATVEQLLQSNRMDPAEAEVLLELLAALRADAPIPRMPEGRPVSDRGREFGATAALSVLLPRLDPDLRGQVVREAARRHNGALPAWVEGTMYGEMLLGLEQEERTDLLLQVDVRQVAAWLQVQAPDAKARLLDGAPTALKAAIAGTPAPATPEELHALANEGRAALSDGLRRRLRARNVPFQAMLA